MNFINSFLNGMVSTVDNLSTKMQPTLDIVGKPLYDVFKPLYDFNENTFSPLVGVEKSGSLFIMILPCIAVMSFIYRLIPRKLFYVKHLYNISFGVLLVAFLYQWGIIHPLFISIVSYLFLMLLPAWISSKITIVFVFVYLSGVQLYEMYAHYLVWKADVTSVLMVMIFKLAAVPFNVYDAERLAKNEEKAKKKLFPHHIECSMKKRPNVIQYFSFLFFFPTVITGPIFEIKHYLDFVENEKAFPFDVRKIISSMAWSCTFMAIYTVFGIIGITPALFEADVIAKQSVIVYLFSAWFVMFGVRGKYHFIWYFAESMCAICGFGYSGDDENGRPKWENTQGCNAIPFECATSVRTMIIEWNISASKWLRYYIYARVPLPGRTLKSLATMTMSAFWHGFYPAYYFMWTALVFLNQCYIAWYSKVYPRLMDRKKELPIYLRVLLICIAQLSINHFGAAFVIYTLDKTVAYYSRINWGVHIAVFSVFLVLMVIPRPKRKKKEKKKKVTND